MPKRSDIHKLMIIGSGPIIIRALYHALAAAMAAVTGIEAYQGDHGLVKSLQSYHMDINPPSADQGGNNQ